MERRQNYRVNDILPIIVTRVDKNEKKIKSKIILGFRGLSLGDVPHEAESRFDPKVWQFLSDINSKLDLILDSLSIDREGLCNATNRYVTISVGGISFTIEDTFEVGEWTEIKILLPTNPAMGIVVYGEVLRVSEPSSGEHEISVDFFELETEVENVLSQYILQRQREILRKRLEL